MIKDIGILVLIYATEPIYTYPKWARYHYSSKIFIEAHLWMMMKNPKAIRHIIKKWDILNDIHDEFSGNPHEKALQIFKETNPTKPNMLCTRVNEDDTEFKSTNINPWDLISNPNPLVPNMFYWSVESRFNEIFDFNDIDIWAHIAAHCPDGSYVIDHIGQIKQIPSYEEHLSKNTTRQVIEYLSENQELIDWASLSSNPSGMKLLMENFDKINMENFNTNSSAVKFLLSNPKLIIWEHFAKNPGLDAQTIISNIDKLSNYIRQLISGGSLGLMQFMDWAHEPDNSSGEYSQAIRMFVKLLFDEGILSNPHFLIDAYGMRYYNKLVGHNILDARTS